MEGLQELVLRRSVDAGSAEGVLPHLEDVALHERVDRLEVREVGLTRPLAQDAEERHRGLQQVDVSREVLVPEGHLDHLPSWGEGWVRVRVWAVGQCERLYSVFG